MYMIVNLAIINTRKLCEQGLLIVANFYLILCNKSCFTTKIIAML